MQLALDGAGGYFLPLLMEPSVDILENNVILIAMKLKKLLFFFFKQTGN